jgi:hypothetical protein
MQIIKRRLGDYATPWTMKIRVRDPQTDRWKDDDLSDVDSAKLTMRREDGRAVFSDSACTVDVANALVSYQPAASDVQEAGLFVLELRLKRSGRPQFLPSDDSDQFYVRLW